VTGTNGKSTTAFLVTQALNALSGVAGYMGTLGYGIGTDLRPSRLTTPGCIAVHRRLKEMLDAGAGHVVTEVSSHALDQNRVAGVRFRVAALTNLTRDHLDYHGSMERYAEAKARLFIGTGIRTAVINVGDRYGAALADQLESGTELITVALVDTAAEKPAARLIGRLTGARADGLGLQLSGDFGQAVLDSPLWGRFNAENLALSVGVLLALGVELDAAVQALAKCVPPPGRMELIRSEMPAPTVVVDFAHTPDALGQVLETVRDHCSGQVWCVFGCGGNRDSGKRRSMGEVAASLADRSVITDDNPRDEDPEKIIAEIFAGTGGGEGIEIVHDRGAAIEFAIHSARPEDVVLIAGKGHESVQIIGAEARNFSDQVVARAALGQAG
jgi:UDP-N-acetylmuramoyl-L-alanyl-D-glutamate--2,6-diaminopimelate ligase